MSVQAIRLDNKVALVMGGAGGIGKALVAGLSRQGAKVVISGLNRRRRTRRPRRSRPRPATK